MVFSRRLRMSRRGSALSLCCFNILPPNTTENHTGMVARALCHDRDCIAVATSRVMHVQGCRVRQLKG